MKPILLVLLSSAVFRWCDDMPPTPPIAIPVQSEFTMTDDTGSPVAAVAPGETFYLNVRIRNPIGSDRLYTHTGPAFSFEILQGAKTVVSSVDGLVWAQVVRTDTLRSGSTDTYRWRAPWPPTGKMPVILPPGSYTAHPVCRYGFIDGFVLHVPDISFSVADKPVPEWVKQLIAAFESHPVGTPPQSIWEYRYHDSTVYYVPPQCCDQWSVLYNEHGVVIGAPDGGIAGGGDGRCPDFMTVKTHERLIWLDPRGAL